MITTRQSHTGKYWRWEDSTQAAWPQSLSLHTCASDVFGVQILDLALWPWEIHPLNLL